MTISNVLNNKFIHSTIGVILSILCLFYIYKIQLPSGFEFKTIPSETLVYSSIVVFAAYLLRVARWSALINYLSSVPLCSLFIGSTIGIFLNALAPGRIGDLFKTKYVSARSDIKFWSVLQTVMIDKLFDVAIIIVVIATVLLSDGEYFDEKFTALNPNFIAYGTGSIILILFAIISFNNVRNRILRIFHDSCKILVSLGYTTATLLIVSFLAMLIDIYAISIISDSFNINLTYYNCFILLSIALLFMLIPSAPGNIGTFHLGVIFGLGIFNVPLNDATNLSIVIHAVLSYSSIVWSSIVLAILYFVSKISNGK